MPDHQLLFLVAVSTWLLTFVGALLAALWLLWRRWSVRLWVKGFDTGLAREALQRAAGDPTATVYDPRLFRRPRD